MVIIEGNLIDYAFQGHFDIIAHGCNCQRMMGAGIAREVKKRIPEMWEADKKDKRFSISKLGCTTSALVVRDGHTFLGYNIYSQYAGGRNLDVEALTLGLRKIAMMHQGQSIGLPMIGCGIAGGNWNEIKEIIRKELKGMEVTIVKFKK